MGDKGTPAYTPGWRRQASPHSVPRMPGAWQGRPGSRSSLPCSLRLGGFCRANQEARAERGATGGVSPTVKMGDGPQMGGFPRVRTRWQQGGFRASPLLQAAAWSWGLGDRGASRQLGTSPFALKREVVSFPPSPLPRPGPLVATPGPAARQPCPVRPVGAQGPPISPGRTGL